MPRQRDWITSERPKSFDEIIMPKAMKTAMDKYVKSDEWPKATLITGKFGSGKTTIAQVMAAYMASRKVESGRLDWDSDPTCLAIKNETWDRDVILLDGTQLSADDVRLKIESFLATPSFRDKRKVIIMDELQDLSSQAVKALLKVSESSRKGYHLIFTAMSKLPKEGGALESRCQKWKLPLPTVTEIYTYLGKMCVRLELTKEPGVPKEFFGKGLEFISQNCQYSFREALNLLEQCFDGMVFTPEEIKSNFNIVTYEDTLATVKHLCYGRIDEPEVFDTIVCKDKEDKFNLFYKIIGDAEVYRVFGRYHMDDEKWKDRELKELSGGPYFDLVRDTYMEIARLGGTYVKQGDYLILMSRIIDKIKSGSRPRLREEETPQVSKSETKRRRVQSEGN